MKVTRVSEHIWSVKLWIIIPIHVWLVREKSGITLVDTGLAMMVKGILNAIEQLQAEPLQRIVLTHGHPDHIGGLQRILHANPVPVYAHRVEIPYIEGELPYRQGKKPVAYMQKGAVQALSEDEHGQLRSIGSLMPFNTPGHSPGHVVFYHEEDQVLLAGDLFTSRNGTLRPALFTSDIEEAVRSSSIVSKLRPARVEVCHGNPLFHAADQIEDYMSKHLKAPKIQTGGQ
ncbi:putative metallo-hydrolase YybB [Insulibacter thermoxylanivorax]|uniref:Metallo-hydrolase YybB n=1 Tax=Insulibacter thermoxylanivorax TaxID=2749268 RepID=A0A916VGH4_9BACL|nr:MBL fold metallo-hydrolase [Insulibacter thermoxylanivorax]GFR38526.1 putative metallo-hydrolase YybB [Insulibacter thermoxylanivorax]